MPKDSKKILIHQFKNTAIQFTHNDKLKIMYFNYDKEEFSVKEFYDYPAIFFFNYTDIFNAVKLFDDGKIFSS